MSRHSDRVVEDGTASAEAGNHTVMDVPLPYGQAILAIERSGPEDDPFGDDALELCHLILPPLRAGLRTLLDQEARRSSLEAALEGWPVAVRITDLAGTELYRNGALRDLLACDTERETVIAALRSLPLTFGGLPQPESTTSGQRTRVSGRGEIRTAVGRYYVGASYMAAGAFDRSPSLLVSVQREQDSLPTPQELRVRHGLTPREAEVALLLACGASNRQIAERLDVSPHTARHHAQHVLEKVGVHTRKGLFLRLLPGGQVHPNQSRSAS